MRPTEFSRAQAWQDQVAALDFAERRFRGWAESGTIKPNQLTYILDAYSAIRKRWEEAQAKGRKPPRRSGLPRGGATESAAARSLRYWTFLEREVRFFSDEGLFSLARTHDLLAEVDEYRDALQRRLSPDEMPEALPVEEEPEESGRRRDVLRDVLDDSSPPAVRPAPGVPRRSLLEILLEPRNIQMLLGLGGALTVVGLVILLWVNQFFSPPVVAIGLGIVNAAFLGGGWWLLRHSRYHLAGRALTLLACLVMPLNLWYYDANGLLTLDGFLWVAGVLITVLYILSALVLRDELFVYVFMAGVTLTGLLFLASLPPSPQKLQEIAAPATLLVLLGVLAIHAERLFPEQDGPFGRRRFGLAFFRAGHAVLAAGLLLVLGATIAGDWLYRPLFARVYRHFNAVPSPIVGELRWLALLLVLAGTYAYVYSDLVVRRVGYYVHIAAATLPWALVLCLELLHIAFQLDALIAVLALTALAVNAVQGWVSRENPYTRAFPILGVLLPLLAVLLGLLVYLRALSHDLKSVWDQEPPGWSYVGAMLITVVSCRLAAHWYREKQPALATLHLFAAGAATLVGATALLAALGLNTWQQHAPLLMLVPIAYLVASRLWRDRPEAAPLLWVSHAAAGVLLVSGLASAVEGFALVRRQTLNLTLALFFAEAATFYALATVFRRRAWTIHLGAAMACAALWQLLNDWDVAAEAYTLTFALVGLALLGVYRFARLRSRLAADAAFQGGNALMALSFGAAVLLGLARFGEHQVHWSTVGLFAVLTGTSLLALALVRRRAWRRWYLIATVGQAGLTFLGLTILSVLTPAQKMEVFCVSVGLLLLVVGHVGWYRERERENDLVSVSLVFGSLLFGLPLAIATLIDRSRDDFIWANEVGFLAAGVLLVTSGFLLRLRATTLIGGGLTVLYFVTLLIRIPWSRLNTLAIFITVGGGTLFGLGLLLSVYRDRLLKLPERIKQRQGIFRVLSWR
jgi:hypothetical protein